jgi:DNA-binding MarR family transcriptional regulator
MDGWIKLHRQLLESDIWTCEPFSRGQAWVDLLLLANHKDSFFYKRGNKIDVKRGQVGRSVVELSNRWKWSRSKVNKFLKDLEKEQQIEQQKSSVTQIVTLINYDEYQEKEQQTEQQKSSRRAAEEQQKDTYKNVKNVKKEKNINNAREKELNNFMKMEKPKRVFDQIMFECKNFSKIEKPMDYESFCQKCLVAKNQVGQEGAINEVCTIIRDIENYIVKSGKEYKIGLAVFNTFTKNRWKK